MPKEEKEEKNSKKAKRMKSKKEQKAEKQENKNSNKIKEQLEEPKEEKKQKKQIEKEQEKKVIKKEKKEKQEQKEKKDTDLIIKDKSLNELQLERIEKEIKTQITITEERKNKIHKKIFQNMLIAIGIVLYFIFINLGFLNIKSDTFFKDLQVFSIISIIFTIVLMEKAYQKDNNEFTLFAIESLVFSICTLCTIYIRNYYSTQFVCSINVIAILFAIYYVGKCIVIDYKMTKKAKKQAMHKHKLTKD